MSDSKGLGDTVDKIMRKTGIKTVVNKVTNGDCNCNQRQEQLNKKFPYKNNK